MLRVNQNNYKTVPLCFNFTVGYGHIHFGTARGFVCRRYNLGWIDGHMDSLCLGQYEWLPENWDKWNGQERCPFIQIDIEEFVRKDLEEENETRIS